MMLDIANTAVARGKLYVARTRGDSIPEGWAIDPAGRSTTDPAAGIAGNILPMGGHKGYAVATMMDLLSGILSGSRFADGVVGPYMAEGRSGVGHFAIAIHIESFRPLRDFIADTESLIEQIKNTPLAAGTQEVFYPGEPEARAEERHRRTGIEIPEDTLAELNAGAAELGIAPLTPSPSGSGLG